MTTSGTVTFESNVNTIVQDAFRVTGILGEGQTLSAEQMNLGLRTLNRMLTHWNTQSIHLWKKRDIILYPVKNKTRFVLPTDRASYADDTIKTEIATAAVSGATAIIVDDSSGIVAADQIGIELDDGTIQWTTVASVLGTTINLSAALTDDVAVDNHVYSYTTTIVKPLNLHDAQLIKQTDDSYAISIISEADYNSLSNKTTAGDPSQVYFKPLLSTSEIYVYQTFDSVKERLQLTCSFSIQDAGTIANTLDIPVEWERAVIYNLGKDLADFYRVDSDTYALVTNKAAAILDDVLAFDRETTSVMMAPDYD